MKERKDERKRETRSGRERERERGKGGHVRTLRYRNNWFVGWTLPIDKQHKNIFELIFLEEE